MPYYVYVLQSTSAPKSYVGMTDDIHRRIAEHNSGKHFYTKRHIPWIIIHTEEYGSRQEAREREEFFKSTSGRRTLKKIFQRLKP